MQVENLQQLMENGAMGMEINHALNFPKDLTSTKKIEYFTFN
jgi:hypothetical protein